VHGNLIVELVDAAGKPLYMIRIPAPVNKNATAPHQLAISIEHPCGCRKRLQSTILECF
jgi:hypothetical protein